MLHLNNNLFENLLFPASKTKKKKKKKGSGLSPGLRLSRSTFMDTCPWHQHTVIYHPYNGLQLADVVSQRWDSHQTPEILHDRQKSTSP